MAETPLLEVRDLQVHFQPRSRAQRRKGYAIRAVDGVSFHVSKGETFGLVGESGCGKSTTGRAVLQLVEPTGGQTTFEGREITGRSRKEAIETRRGMQVIFQDPYDSLNPRMTIESSIAEPMIAHGVARADRKQRVRDLLELVGLDPELRTRRPSELSGGQRQRVCIARALAVDPQFIVCDEAVSALDVSVQAQILNLLRRLQRELGISYLFIGHDLSVVRLISDRIGVMYAGKIVEVASSEDLYSGPNHPYTLSLLASSPVADPRIERNRPFIPAAGEPPSPMNPPSGCRFASRCPLARQYCWDVEPPLVEVEPGRWTACHFWTEVEATPAALGTGVETDE